MEIRENNLCSTINRKHCFIWQMNKSIEGECGGGIYRMRQEEYSIMEDLVTKSVVECVNI